MPLRRILVSQTATIWRIASWGEAVLDACCSHKMRCWIFIMTPFPGKSMILYQNVWLALVRYEKAAGRIWDAGCVRAYPEK